MPKVKRMLPILYKSLNMVTTIIERSSMMMMSMIYLITWSMMIVITNNRKIRMTPFIFQLNLTKFYELQKKGG